MGTQRERTDPYKGRLQVHSFKVGWIGKSVRNGPILACKNELDIYVLLLEIVVVLRMFIYILISFNNLCIV